MNLLSRSSQFRALRAFVLVILVFPCALASVADDTHITNKRVAILSSGDVRASGLSDLLTVQAQELEGIELVERDMLDKALDEIELNEMFGAVQTSNRKMAGRLLGADMLILLSIERIDEKENVRYVICDCPSGARLRIGWVGWDKDKVEDSAEELKRTVGDTLEHYRGGIQQIIAVPDFVSRSLLHDYDHLQAGYAHVLSNAVSSALGVAVLEIEEAKSVRNELDLTGQTLRDRVVPLFVEGEFTVSNGAERNGRGVSVHIAISDNSGIIKNIDREDMEVEETAAYLAGDAAANVLSLSKSGTQPLAKEIQLDLLVGRADEFERVGAWYHSTELREAALLLEPVSVEQRAKVIREYERLRRLIRKPGFSKERAKRIDWNLSMSHAEYLIRNHLLNMTQGVSYFAKAYECPHSEPQRRDALRNVYPAILELEHHRREPWHEQEWYDWLMVRLSVMDATKENLDLFVYLQNYVVPEDFGPSRHFIRIIEKCAEPLRGKQLSSSKVGTYPQNVFNEHSLAFFDALSRSNRRLPSLYGRYGLLLLECRQTQMLFEKTDHMADDVEALLVDVEQLQWGLTEKGSDNKENRLLTAVRVLRNRILGLRDNMHASVTRGPAQGSEDKEESSRPPSKGRLKFNRIPLMVRDMRGQLHSMNGKTWRTGYISNGPRRLIKCGEGLDVMWLESAVLFMKEEGVLEEVLIDESKSCVYFDECIWDGENVWVGTRREGIWILNTDGKVVAKINSETGLPPADNGLQLHPIKKGKVIAVGSFGPHFRAWCAIVEYGADTASIDIFHQATGVSAQGENMTTLAARTDMGFISQCINSVTMGKKTFFLVGRKMEGNWYAGGHPYIIDLDKLTVHIEAPQANGGVRFIMDAATRQRFLGCHGSLFSNSTMGVSRYSFDGREFSRERYLCKDFTHGGTAKLAGPLLEYDGMVYAPGPVWFRFDPVTLNEERLVYPELPKPYATLSYYAVSAHYGLVGWDWSVEYNYDGFYQIQVSDEEQIYGNFHRFVFEDANGPITDSKRLQSLGANVVGKDGIRFRYKKAAYNTAAGFDGYFKNGSYFVPGTYSPALDHFTQKQHVFEPVEITDDSPEEIIFRLPGEDEITFTGKVINALTGEPMKGAFVVGRISVDNLTRLTEEQWVVLHKLPACISPGLPAIWPLQDLDSFPIEGIGRTDEDGCYSLSYRKRKVPYIIMAFEQGFMTTSVHANDLIKEGGETIAVEPLPLFPAAKITVKPILKSFSGDKPYSGVLPSCWLRFAPASYRGAQRSLSALLTYNTSTPRIEDPDLAVNRASVYHIPADVDLKLQFSIPYDDRWCIPEIPGAVHLKQGEHLDLGEFVFEPALEIPIKVVNWEGHPFRSVVIKKHSDDPYHGIRFETDDTGIVHAYLEPNSIASLSVRFGSEHGNLERDVEVEIGGREDSGEGFTFVLGTDRQISVLRSTTESFEQTQDSVTAPAESRLNLFILATGFTEDDRPTDDVNEVSFDTERIYAYTCWNLSAGEHRYVVKIFDDEGGLINRYEHATTPYQPHWHFWSWYNLDRTRDKPGMWKYEVYIDGEKAAEKTLTVRPQ